MKRIKNRKKHFRINNPLGFSLFCATIILILGLIGGLVYFFTSGAFHETLACFQQKMNSEQKSAPNALPTEAEKNGEATPNATDPNTADPSAGNTESPTPGAEPADKTAEPGTPQVETPQPGTPQPEIETPPPIVPDTAGPGEAEETPEPTPDADGPLAGFTIGIDPRRDKGSDYKKECAYNLEFAQKLAEYLESKGAKVVLTRDSNDSKISSSSRAKTLKNAKCDIAIGLMCNEVDSKNSGCYTQSVKKYTKYAKALSKAYSDETGIKFGKKNGWQSWGENDQVGSKTGCPYALLILGNWKNKNERANLQDEAFQEKMIEAIYQTLLSQLNK